MPALPAQRRGRQRRTRLVCSLLALVVFGLLAADILLGSFTVTVPDFLAILGGKNIPGASFIVMENKLPRSILALLVGAAFGVAGQIFQTMLRNPLASPDVIGISSGASASAVVAIVLFSASGAAVSVLAVLGALVVAGTISLLARGRSGAALARAGGRLILIGIGVAALMNALVVFLMQRAQVYRAQEALIWLTGSLNQASWQRIGVLLVGLMVVAPFAVFYLSRLRVLVLGGDLAAGLGVPVSRTVLGLSAVGVALAALATAATGPISFVSFLAGPISRRLLRGRVSFAAAALVGAGIVLAADYAAAYLLPGGAMPVGVVTGAAGAPFLLWLLARGSGSGTGQTRS
ncbi:FecCD family ABC transporter permease [Psychromicrobium xiongbiense]|uniref:FecCD family ABC transporter permease n=1 Tax=Psychromicrobium xiongbiense TaxID=3051184 RepID=UPI0025575A1F|nr:iron chelate uptake ABC transporter family permease subunit [Psychromicrobium sp. YIM S02556]